MADFSDVEKLNASWKHLLGIVGTSNLGGSAGKFPHEEFLTGSHIVTLGDIWSENVPAASTRDTARTLAAISGSVVEDRSNSESISLVANGSNWDITTTGIIPVEGFQVSNTHPSPSYVRSITAVVDNGGGNYTITLNSNSGVSAGAAVLHSRIFLTVDPSSNGVAWFTKSVYGNHFSNRIENFIHGQRFGRGYTARVFQANGTEVINGTVPWIFSWQTGLLLFPDNYSPSYLGLVTPLYVELFRYIGDFGTGSSSLTPGNINDTLRYNGASWEPTSSLQISTSDVFVANNLTISGATIVSSGVTPSGSFAPGVDGEIRRGSNYIYYHTGGRWVRTAFQEF